MTRPVLEFCGGGCGRKRVAGPDFFVEKDTGRPRSRCRHCLGRQAKEWRERNPEKHRDIYRRANHAVNVKKRFGLTVEQFAGLTEKCSGLCGICEKPETRERRLSLDHNHETGELRGFVCSRCNLLLGNARDDVRLLLRAAAYLEHPPLRGVEIA